MTTPIIRSFLSVVTLIPLVIFPTLGLAQDSSDPVIIGERFEIESEILDETRPIIVGTPRSYESGQETFAALYVLDGSNHFHYTTAIANFLAANDRIPEMLVVGVPNFTNRSRDLTPPAEGEVDPSISPEYGGANDFLRFLSDELMPWVDERYRTRQHTILVGHSLGGLFTLHALVTQPDVFDGYIAISPSLQWDDQALVSRAETFFENTPELTADLYMTMGNETGADLGGLHKLAGVLDEHAPKGFRWNMRVMPEETHGSVPLRSFRQGLEAIFEGWNLGLRDLMTAFDEGGLQAVDGRYRASGERFGYERMTHPFTVVQIVFNLLDMERLEEAEAVLMRDPDKHPPPPMFLRTLAGAYEARGDADRAREIYTAALSANPADEQIRSKLTEMSVDVASLLPAVEVTPETLARYEGQYRLTAGRVVTIRVEDGALTAETTGSPKRPMLPLSETKFFIEGVEAQYHFNTNAAGEVEGLTVRQFGQQLVAPKID